jgi:hypothetical protein
MNGKGIQDDAPLWYGEKLTTIVYFPGIPGLQGGCPLPLISEFISGRPGNAEW